MTRSSCRACAMRKWHRGWLTARTIHTQAALALSRGYCWQCCTTQSKHKHGRSQRRQQHSRHTHVHQEHLQGRQLAAGCGGRKLVVAVGV